MLATLASGLLVVPACGEPQHGGKSNLMAPDVGVDATDSCAFGELVSGLCAPEPPRAASADECGSGLIDGRVCGPEAPRPATDDDCPAQQRSPDGFCLPDLPQLADWPCPEGFDPVQTSSVWTLPADLIPGFAICRARLPSETCGVAAFPVVGANDCQPIGTACPQSQRWPSESVIRDNATEFDGDVIYVASDGTDDAAGTRLSPMDLRAALTSASDGDIVALGVGTYSTPDEGYTVANRVALIGSCATDTVLEGTPSDRAALVVESFDTLMRDLTVSGSRPGIVVSSSASTVTIESVVVDGAEHVGLQAADAEVTLRGVYLRDITSRADAESSGNAVVVSGGSIGGQRVTIDGAAFAAIVAGGSAIVELDELLIQRVGHGEPEGGQAVAIGVGPDVSLTRAVLRENHGLALAGFGGHTVLTDVAIEDTSGPRGGAGVGLAVYGGRLDGTRVWVSSASHFNVDMRNGHASLADSVVADARASNGGLGFGVVAAGGSLSLERTLVVGNMFSGITAFDELGTTSVQVRDSVVAHTRPDVDGMFGAGLTVFDDVAVALDRVAFYRNHAAAVWAGDGLPMVVASDLTVIDTLPQPSNGLMGHAIFIQAGDVEVNRGQLAGNHHAGVLVDGEASKIHLTDVTIRDTAIPDEEFPFLGEGITVWYGAEATLTRVASRGNEGHAFHFTQSGTTVTASDLVAVGPTSEAVELRVGVTVDNGAAVEVDRLFVDNVNIGATSIDGSDLRIRDATIRSTVPLSGGDGDWLGAGLIAELNGSLVVERALLDDNVVTGLLAGGGALVELSDVAMRSGYADPSGRFGRGISILTGARVSGRRLLVSGNRDAGVIALNEGSFGDLSDVWILDTESSPVDGRFGRGVVAQSRAELVLRRAEVLRSRGFGALALSGATLLLEDARLVATDPARCEDRFQCTVGDGHGVGAFDGGTVTIRAFEVADSAIVGFRVAPAGTIVASDGLLIGNLIAVNVQNDDFDIDEAFANVVLLDNDVDLDAQNLPVPEANEVLESIPFE